MPPSWVTSAAGWTALSITWEQVVNGMPQIVVNYQRDAIAKYGLNIDINCTLNVMSKSSRKEGANALIHCMLLKMQTMPVLQNH